MMRVAEALHAFDNCEQCWRVPICIGDGPWAPSLMRGWLQHWNSFHLLLAVQRFTPAAAPPACRCGTPTRTATCGRS